jgi:hypothetical protein
MQPRNPEITDGEWIVELRQELSDSEELVIKLGDLLSKTAIALHGGRLKNGLWSTHDLAEIAARHRRLLVAALHALRSYQYENASTELAEEMAEELERVLNGRRSETEPVAELKADGKG